MQTSTTPQATTIKELSSALRSHMAKIGYRPRTIQLYGYVLQELEDYCEAHNISAFTTELGNQFVWERYGMKLGDQFTSKTVNHVLRMIADYQKQGKVSKRYSRVYTEPSQAYAPLVESAVESFRRTNAAENSVRRYHWFLLRFGTFLQDRGVVYFNQLELHHVNVFVESLTGLSESTVRATVGHLKRLFDYARDHGYHHTSFSNVLPAVRYHSHRRLPETFTVEEVERILNSIDRHNPTGQRNYTMLLLVARLPSHSTCRIISSPSEEHFVL